MRRFFIAFGVVLSLSVAMFFSLAVFFGAYGNIFKLDKKLSEKERQNTFGYLDRVALNISKFDEEFYLSIANDEKYDRKKLQEFLDENFDKLEFEKTESEYVNSLLERYKKYVGLSMRAKSNIASGKLQGASLVSTFDSVEYNVVASEATYRLIKKILNDTDDKVTSASFLPDEVTAVVLNRVNCYPNLKDGEVYENALGWFMGVSAMKSSFDTKYLQILFGASLYSQNELAKMIGEMEDINKIIRQCLPPEALGSLFYMSYVPTLQNYSSKIELAEYHSFSVFQNEAQILEKIEKVYSMPQASSVIAKNIGYDAFDTLATVTLFELYSQNRSLDSAVAR